MTRCARPPEQLEASAPCPFGGPEGRLGLTPAGNRAARLGQAPGDGKLAPRARGPGVSGVLQAGRPGGWWTPRPSSKPELFPVRPLPEIIVLVAFSLSSLLAEFWVFGERAASSPRALPSGHLWVPRCGHAAGGSGPARTCARRAPAAPAGDRFRCRGPAAPERPEHPPPAPRAPGCRLHLSGLSFLPAPPPPPRHLGRWWANSPPRGSHRRWAGQPGNPIWGTVSETHGLSVTPGSQKRRPVPLGTGRKGSSDMFSLCFHGRSLIFTEKLNIYLKILLHLLQKNHYKDIRTKLL